MTSDSRPPRQIARSLLCRIMPYPPHDGLGAPGRHTVAELLARQLPGLLFDRLAPDPDDRIALYGDDRAPNRLAGLRIARHCLGRRDKANRAALRDGEALLRDLSEALLGVAARAQHAGNAETTSLLADGNPYAFLGDDDPEAGPQREGTTRLCLHAAEVLDVLSDALGRINEVLDRPAGRGR